MTKNASLSSLPTSSILDIPDEFICPLTLNILRDPVMMKSGISFERKAIIQWINQYGNNTCPLTRQPLALSDLVSNHALRQKIQKWKFEMTGDVDDDDYYYDKDDDDDHNDLDETGTISDDDTDSVINEVRNLGLISYATNMNVFEPVMRRHQATSINSRSTGGTISTSTPRTNTTASTHTSNRWQRMKSKIFSVKRFHDS